MTDQQRAHVIALTRLATTAANDARQCDDDALAVEPELAKIVRKKLEMLSEQLFRRASEIGKSRFSR